MAQNNTDQLNEKSKTSVVSKPLVKTKGEVKDIEGVTFYYMLNNLNIPQPELIRYHSAKCPAKVKGMAAYVVRFFSFEKASELKINIKDFESLSEYPELILYEGYYVRGKGGEVNIVKRAGTGTSFLEENINSGNITDIGLERPRGALGKIMSRIAKFMMLGGFLLVIVVVAILVFLITIWSKNC